MASSGLPDRPISKVEYERILDASGVPAATRYQLMTLFLFTGTLCITHYISPKKWPRAERTPLSERRKCSTAHACVAHLERCLALSGNPEDRTR